MDCSMPGFLLHHQLLFAQTHVHPAGDAIQLSFPSPPAFNLSQHQGLFQWVSSSHQVAKYWSFSFSIRPSKEHPGLVSFRMDWLDLLAVQETLKSLLQHHSSKASILNHRVSHVALVVKNPPTNAGDIRDAGWIPGSGGYPGDGSGYLLLPGESHGQRSLVGYSP